MCLLMELLLEGFDFDLWPILKRIDVYIVMQALLELVLGR